MNSSSWNTQSLCEAINYFGSNINMASFEILKAFNSSFMTYYLYNNDGSYNCGICIDNNTSYMLENNHEQQRDQIYWNLYNNQTFIFENNTLYVPIKTKTTKIFGMAVLHDVSNKNQFFLSDFQNMTFNAFAESLYSEFATLYVPSNNPSVLDVRDLVVKYSNKHRTTVAVNNVSLNIKQGEFTVLLGTSGCGKTSLLNAMGGILKPAHGSIFYNGKNIAKFNKSQAGIYRKNIVGFIFQQYNLIKDLTAKENIEVASSLSKNRVNTMDLLAQVGLADKANNYPSQISGGEQQRVCIARALSKNPKLLLCDEPTGALDSNSSIAVMEILQNLSKYNGTPIVVITHNEDFACLADHYILMSNGQIIDERQQPFPVDASELELR